MSQPQDHAYAIDLVLVIDATGSMDPFIASVKSRALSLHDELSQHISTGDTPLGSLRARVIAYRDFYADEADKALVTSDFFELPGEREGFAAFVDGIEATGGGDEPETGLEGLAAAIRSPWATTGTEKRQVIVLWTDASAHPLEKDTGTKPAGYPQDMPASMDELTTLWTGAPYHVHPAWKRLLLFTPDKEPWTYLARTWDSTAHYPSQAGTGLAGTDYGSVLEAIAGAAQDSAWPPRSRAAPATVREPADRPGRRPWWRGGNRA